MVKRKHIPGARSSLVLVAALQVCAAVAVAQAPPGSPFSQDGRSNSQVRPPGEGTRAFKSPAGTRAMSMIREGNSSGPLAMFRLFMRDEIKNVPALAPKVNSLAEMQQQRNALQRQRASVAEDRSLSADESLRKFHDLMKREDELNNRQRGLLDELVKDTPQIQKQISDRRQQIQKRLEELGEPEPTMDFRMPATPEEQEARNLAHADKLYQFLDKRLQMLQENPDRLDLLNRFFKGMPTMEEPEGPALEDARRKLEQMQNEHDDLTERMQRLEGQIREMRQFLRQPGSGEPHWHRDSDDNPRPWDNNTTRPRPKNAPAGAAPPGSPPPTPI